MRESPSHRLKLTEKARKIATPPNRGSGDLMDMPSALAAAKTQPRRVAMSRTSTRSHER